MRIALVATVLYFFAGSAVAQTREAGPWWPNSTWGRGDQAGASNWITPELRALGVLNVKPILTRGILIDLAGYLALDELARDGVHEFLLVFTPVRFKGATGSPGRSIAIR